MARTRLHIGTYADIPVYIHWSFLLLLTYIGYTGWAESGTIPAIVISILTVLAVFVCVILHEFGHALAARRYGIGTHDIVMYPIGGVARLNSIPENPFQELVVAVAGPAVNIAIAIILYAINPFIDTESNVYFITSQLLYVNLFLVLFNMIPAFPMDGGRALRAVLSMAMPRLRATFVAMWIGRVFAAIFVALGLFGNSIMFYLFGIEDFHTSPFLAVIGVFITLGAKREYDLIAATQSLSGKTVGEIAHTNITAFGSDELMSVAIPSLQSDDNTDFLVADGAQQIVGVLTREAIQAAADQKDSTATIAEYMHTDVPTLAPAESVKTAYDLMQKTGCPLLFVIENGKLLGVVHFDAIKALAQRA